MKLIKWRGIYPLLIVIICVVLLVALIGYPCADPAEVSTFEGGAAYRTADDIYWVLTLSGSWKEMGRQYGGLVADDLQEFHAAITQDIARRGMDSDDLLEVAEALTVSLNSNMRELMQGMSETSGLTYDQIQQLNAGMFSSDLVFGEKFQTLLALPFGGLRPTVALLSEKLGHGQREHAEIHEVPCGGSVQPGFRQQLCGCAPARQYLC